MKKILYIVGAGLIVGAVATTVVCLLNNKKKKECNKESVAADNESLAQDIITRDEPVYEDVKSSAIGSMYSRHEDAATIMSDSVKAIREKVKISEDTNDEIDDVSAELDEMLSEE